MVCYEFDEITITIVLFSKSDFMVALLLKVYFYRLSKFFYCRISVQQKTFSTIHSKGRTSYVSRLGLLRSSNVCVGYFLEQTRDIEESPDTPEFRKVF